MPDTAVAERTRTPILEPIQRASGGRFAPGISANPTGLSGKPSLGPRIRELTHDGADILRAVVGVLNDSQSGRKLKLEAATWLADRGWGRPAQAIELSGELTDTSALAGFTPEEMRAWLDMRRSARKTAQMAALAAETASEPVPVPESATR